MNKSDIKDYSAGLVKSIKSGKLTFEEAVIESSAATGCTKDFARKILSECLTENKAKKPIKSGITYDQALDMFTSEGKPWDDYWSMQQDWTAFIDSLERNGDVDYEESRWWDNPCTPKTFDEWVGRSNDDEYDEYYDDGEIINSRKSVKSAKKPIKSMRYNTLSELNNVINILWDINDVARSTCGEEGYQAIKTAITAVQDAWNICKQGMEKKGMDTSVYSSRKPIKSANYNGFNLEARRSYGKGNGYFTTYPVWDTDLDTSIGAIEYHYAVENPYYVAWVYDDFGVNKTGRTKAFDTEEECLEWIGGELASGTTARDKLLKYWEELGYDYKSKNLDNSRKPVKSSIEESIPDNGLRIITHDYDIMVHEDDWEEGEGDFVNGWDGKLNGSFATKEELYKAIENEIYLPVNDQTADFYDGRLVLSWTVNVDNEQPSESEIEAWKRGEEKMYTLDMNIPLEVGSETHNMSDDEAISFGFIPV